MRYVGIDLRKQSITVCVVDQDRTALQTRRFACVETARIDASFAGLGPFEAVVEATAGYRWPLERIEPPARRVALAPTPASCGSSPRAPRRATGSTPAPSPSSWPWI
jgi:transposase